MSGRRLLGTAMAMAAIAGVLAVLAPPVQEMTATVLAAQDTVDRTGAEALLTAAAGMLAWGVWAWGALGLALTAASALPGAVGRVSVGLVRVVLPGGARRAAALALGLGLGLSGPLAATTLLVATAPAAAAGPVPAAVPDWPVPAPAAPVGGPPDWPDAPVPIPSGSHVVVRGDCLWDIAAAALSAGSGRTPSPAEVARATHSWWAANADVIGPDPDLLLPGQVLRPPP
ncbi:hypothetical protein SAMN05660485_00339 [Blastococcus fimeti]|nr:hypothetical protein SAMN05660485_00339 [Blastococcus fimeti]